MYFKYKLKDLIRKNINVLNLITKKKERDLKKKYKYIINISAVLTFHTCLSQNVGIIIL